MSDLIGEKKEETSLIISQYVNNDINLFGLVIATGQKPLILEITSLK